MEYPEPAVVIDNGTATIKAGFAGDNFPCVEFPSIVAHKEKDTYVGDRALCKYGYGWTHKNPIEGGVVSHWEDMENIWEHAFTYELCVNPKKHPVLLTETLSNPKVNREMTTEIMFEVFETPCMYLENTAILSLYSNGLTTGLVFESGDGVTNILPVFDGYSIKEGMSTIDLAGGVLTDSMKTLLIERGYSFEHEILKDIKEKFAYVALYPVKEMIDAKSPSYKEKSYKLPDGQEIAIGSESFRCGEILFQQSGGIHNIIFNSIEKCNHTLRRDLYDCILLHGGTAMLPGIAERLRREIWQKTPNRMQISVSVSAPSDGKKYGAWRGGSILAKHPTFHKNSISKADYDESGVSIVHAKCKTV